MTNEKMPKNAKNAENFFCEKCNFTCSKESNYIKHLATRKHQIRTNTKKYEEKMPKNAATAYECECGRVYKHASSLWNHKKKCAPCITEIPKKTEDSEVILKNNTETDLDYKSLFLNALDQMREERKEFMQIRKKQDDIMMEMIDKVGNTTNNTNNNLNINMFLNEQCKDAINFSEFINRIEVSQDDLENNAQLGFVNGITKILMDNLRQLTLHERPIHCTDSKREILYIKDDDEWQKENDNNKLMGAIKEVSRKSMSSLLSWKNDNPEYGDVDSEFSNKCVVIQKQSLAGENKETYYPKVIHNVAKATAIVKDKIKIKN
jgi:hypothetical protein